MTVELDLDHIPHWESREWMIVKGKQVLRHRAFKDADRLHRWVQQNGNCSVYHSTAVYSRPAVERMGAKGFFYSDLVFDLDYDHMERLEMAMMLEQVPFDATYEEVLDFCQEQAIRLEEIVEDHFGCEDLTWVFSGSRGFHLHVRDPWVYKLDRADRREIQDYVVFHGAEADPAVTPDPHSMIRCPGSIHPKTGKHCRIIPDIKTFDIRMVD